MNNISREMPDYLDYYFGGNNKMQRIFNHYIQDEVMIKSVIANFLSRDLM